MGRKLLYIVLAVLAVVFGLYPILYYLNGDDFRILSLKSPELLASILWRGTFFTHITGGGLSLLIGWMQFSKKLRGRAWKTHRLIGKVYVIAALAGGLAGTILSFSASGGLIAKAGFFLLGVTWLTFTYRGYAAARAGRIAQHQTLMIYSYACCFAAATLRVWLTALGPFMDFFTIYRLVAWLSWVPNLVVAYLMVQRLQRRGLLQEAAYIAQ